MTKKRIIVVREEIVVVRRPKPAPSGGGGGGDFVNGCLPYCFGILLFLVLLGILSLALDYKYYFPPKPEEIHESYYEQHSERPSWED